MDKVISLLCVFLLSCMSLSAQEKERIDILNADDVYIERNVETKSDWHRLLGNIAIRHNDMDMFCDSAHYYPEITSVDAYSNIHIQQGDTLHLYGDILNYNGVTYMAELSGGVELINKETHLFTEYALCDVKNRIAYYYGGGKIVNGDNTLISDIGIYYATQDLFSFKDNVNITTPEYQITSDTLQFNTVTEIATFHGPTDLYGDSLFLHCEQGWYDTKNDISNIWKNATVNNTKQFLKGDSIYYNDATGFGETFGNISIIDTTNKMMITGNYAWVLKSPETFMVTDSAMFVQFSGDSIFLHADTLRSITVSDTADYRLLKAYHKCRIFSQNLQSTCDSLSFSFQDSVIRLYYSPVIWSDSNQLTSDSVALFTKKMNPDRLELYGNAFVVNEVDNTRYNQIKGRLSGYFENNNIYKIYIDGNGESIYYIVDGDQLIGVNITNCSTIDIRLEDGEITEIYQNIPNGNIDPPLYDSNNTLSGFQWLDEIRPKKIEDIFKR